MELFLNLCWLSLLLPAWLLWRRRHGSGKAVTSTGKRAPLVFLCALGCALILLFPVISATDDLHAMRPEMEESERGFRHAGHCACNLHAPVHSALADLPSSAALTTTLEQIGTILPFLPQTAGVFSALAPAGRAPPIGPLAVSTVPAASL
ncbi:MAG: hypothetical protein WCA97_15320 [Terriglobales bacterium]|jgi:hypothetical protein